MRGRISKVDTTINSHSFIKRKQDMEIQQFLIQGYQHPWQPCTVFVEHDAKTLTEFHVASS